MVELLEGTYDDAASCGIDALIGGELCEVVGQLLLDNLVALRRHRIDDDVP